MNYGIQKSINIQPLTLTASDWQLYTDHKVKEVVSEPHPWEKDEDGNPVMRNRTIWETDPAGEQTIESEKCAVAMNEAFVRTVNAGGDAVEVYAAVHAATRDFNSGGTDTEPRCVLHDLLDETFGVRDAYEVAYAARRA